MSTRFLDGPAAGQVLMLARAPFLLRVVCSPTGNWDALDQLDDLPAPRERVHVYVRKTEPFRFHLSCRPRSRSGWYESADYAHVPDGPDDEDVLRHAGAWRRWCGENAERLGYVRLGYRREPPRANGAAGEADHG